MHALHAVTDSAPVAHDIAFKAPLIAQDIRQQPSVLGGILTVDLVIRAHDGPGLGLFDRALKCRQIDFAQRALVDNRIARHAAVFLAVGSKMLDARADIPALHALNEGGRQFARQIGVFAEILEVSPAQR